MVTSKNELSIIVPTHNEADVVIKTLEKLGDLVKLPHEIIVVDDSIDGTTKLVRQYSRKNHNVFLVTGKEIKFGRALQLGIGKARTDKVVVVMGDLCDDPKTIDRMYKKIQDGWDVVCGSRYMKGGKKIGGPFLQGLFSFLFCKLMHLFLGIPTTDVSNAFKMYKKRTLKDVVFNFESGMEASMEVFLQAYFNGAKVLDVPTVWRGRAIGKSKFKMLFRAPKYLTIFLGVLISRVKIMFRKIPIQKVRRYFPFVLIFLVAILAYWQTVRMFWWVDDWGLVYKMIFPLEAPNPSNFGAGFFGQGAYRHNATPFIFLYPLFGLSAPTYFAIGIFQYFLTACVLYLFIKDITKKGFPALLSSIIFASGYIGSYAMYRLSNSYQLVETGLLLILFTWLLIKHYQSGKSYFYWLSLLLFIITIEFLFLRAQGILLIGLTATILFARIKIDIRSFMIFVLKQLPFVGIYIFFYFIDYRGGPELGGNTVRAIFSHNLQLLMSREGSSLITNLLASFLYLAVPDQPINSVFKFLRLNHFEYYSKILGGLLILSLFTLFLRKVREGKKEALIIFLGIVWVFSNIFTYFFYMPTSIFVSNSRYAIPAFVGIAMVWGTTFSFISKKWLSILIVVILSASLIYLANREQSSIVQHISTPDRQGYALIKKEVPGINKNTIFYIETVDDPTYKSNVLGNIPQLGIPSMYKTHGPIKIASSYNELFSLLGQGESQISDIYTMFFSADGYKFTTQEFRDILMQKNNTTILSNWQALGLWQGYFIDIGAPSLTPNLLHLKIRAFSRNGINTNEVGVWWMTDRRNIFVPEYSKNINLYLDGKSHDYEVLIPAQGTILKQIKVENSSPTVKIVIERSTIHPLNLNEIEGRAEVYYPL